MLSNDWLKYIKSNVDRPNPHNQKHADNEQKLLLFHKKVLVTQRLLADPQKQLMNLPAPNNKYH